MLIDLATPLYQLALSANFEHYKPLTVSRNSDPFAHLERKSRRCCLRRHRRPSRDRPRLSALTAPVAKLGRVAAEDDGDFILHLTMFWVAASGIEP
jgi:hypothetical protein